MLIELTKCGDFTFKDLSQNVNGPTALEIMLKNSFKHFYELITVLKDQINTLAMEKLKKQACLKDNPIHAHRSEFLKQKPGAAAPTISEQKPLLETTFYAKHSKEYDKKFWESLDVELLANLSMCDGYETLIHTLATGQTKEFLFLIYNNKINISELKKIKDHDGDSPFHSLAFDKAYYLLDLIEDKILTIKDLINLKDKQEDTPFHIFAQYCPDYLIKIIEHNLISIPEIAQIKNNEEKTPIHTLANNYPEYIVEMIENNLISIEEIAQMKDKDVDTPFHAMVADEDSEEGRECLMEMIKSELISVSDLAKMKNNEEKTPFDLIGEIV